MSQALLLNFPKHDLQLRYTCRVNTVNTVNINTSVTILKIGKHDDEYSIVALVKVVVFIQHICYIFRTLANYMMWRRVEYELKALPEIYREQKQLYEQVKNNTLNYTKHRN